MRGRKPKSERLKTLAGEYRIIGGTEPPTAPEWLDGDAKKEWDRLVGELAELYLVTPLDAIALAAYCETYVMWREASKQVKEQGTTYIADNGNLRVNPAAKLCLSLFESLRRMGAEFGFSPQARSRLDCNKPETEESDTLTSFLESR